MTAVIADLTLRGREVVTYDKENLETLILNDFIEPSILNCKVNFFFSIINQNLSISYDLI